jgi:RNA:NAD 2'-phosphotransferase (TPT1/KptA family)
MAHRGSSNQPEEEPSYDRSRGDRNRSSPWYTGPPPQQQQAQHPWHQRPPTQWPQPQQTLDHHRQHRSSGHVDFRTYQNFLQELHAEWVAVGNHSGQDLEYDPFDIQRPISGLKNFMHRLEYRQPEKFSILVQEEELSKCLAFVTRHDDRTPKGCDASMNFLKCLQEKRSLVSKLNWNAKLFAYMVAMNTKQRYQIAFLYPGESDFFDQHREVPLRPDNRWLHGVTRSSEVPIGLAIRATQGHSNGPYDLSLVYKEIIEPDDQPEYSVHGTSYEAWRTIEHEGLLPDPVAQATLAPHEQLRRGRREVHFANVVPEDPQISIPGVRANSKVFIFHANWKCAIHFRPMYLSANGYLLRPERVDPEYFDAVIDINTMKELYGPRKGQPAREEYARLLMPLKRRTRETNEGFRQVSSLATRVIIERDNRAQQNQRVMTTEEAASIVRKVEAGVKKTEEGNQQSLIQQEEKASRIAEQASQSMAASTTEGDFVPVTVEEGPRVTVSAQAENETPEQSSSTNTDVNMEPAEPISIVAQAEPETSVAQPEEESTIREPETLVTPENTPMEISEPEGTTAPSLEGQPDTETAQAESVQSEPITPIVFGAAVFPKQIEVDLSETSSSESETSESSSQSSASSSSMAHQSKRKKTQAKKMIIDPIPEDEEILGKDIPSEPKKEQTRLEELREELTEALHRINEATDTNPTDLDESDADKPDWSADDSPSSAQAEERRSMPILTPAVPFERLVLTEKDALQAREHVRQAYEEGGTAPAVTQLGAYSSTQYERGSDDEQEVEGSEHSFNTSNVREQWKLHERPASVVPCIQCNSLTYFFCYACGKACCAECRSRGLACQCRIHAAAPPSIKSRLTAMASSRHADVRNDEARITAGELADSWKREDLTKPLSAQQRKYQEGELSKQYTEVFSDPMRPPTFEEMVALQPKEAFPLILPAALENLAAQHMQIPEVAQLWQKLLAKQMTSRSQRVQSAQAEGHNSSTLQLSACLVNLGSITRPPRIGNKELDGNLRVLTEIWASSWGHIVGTVEADDLKTPVMQEIAAQFLLKGIVRPGQYAPAIALHVRGDSSAQVELLDVLETHHLASVHRQREIVKENRWDFHGGIFKVTFGKESDAYKRDHLGNLINPEQEHQVPQEVAQAARDPEPTKVQREPKDISIILTEVDNLRNPDEQVINEDSLTRAQMNEIKVAIYHINNEFAKKPDNCRKVFMDFIKMCMVHEVDLLYGDANTAGTRYFAHQKVADPKNSMVACCVKAAQVAINRQMDFHNRLNVTQVENTPYEQWVKFTKDPENMELDCCIAHVFGWGKTPSQQMVRAAYKSSIESGSTPVPENLHEAPADWLVGVSERFKYQGGLLHLLRKKDKNSHSILMLTLRQPLHKGFRQRTAKAKAMRKARWDEKRQANRAAAKAKPKAKARSSGSASSSSWNARSWQGATWSATWASSTWQARGQTCDAQAAVNDTSDHSFVLIIGLLMITFMLGIAVGIAVHKFYRWMTDKEPIALIDPPLQRSVAVQSMTTYTLLRNSANPRFHPLPEYAHGANIQYELPATLHGRQWHPPPHMPLKRLNTDDVRNIPNPPSMPLKRLATDDDDN